jgi:hypothetical protein
MKPATVAVLLIAMLLLATAAFAAPAKPHQHRHAKPFPMSDCIKGARHIYGKAEAKAYCDDLKVGA